jgi:hypothetical protein
MDRVLLKKECREIGVECMGGSTIFVSLFDEYISTNTSIIADKGPI